MMPLVITVAKHRDSDTVASGIVPIRSLTVSVMTGSGGIKNEKLRARNENRC